MTHRCLLFGTSGFGLPAFEALRLADVIDVVGLVSQPSRPVGRHQLLTPPPAAQWAIAHHLPLLTLPTLKNPDAVEQLRAVNADTYIVAAYGLILPSTVLDIPEFGCLNIHASLLPKFRGASPIPAAIANGDEQTGITIMLMDAGLDTGQILAQLPLSIQPQEHRPALEQRLAILAATEILAVLHHWWQRQITPHAQPSAGMSLAPKITRADGQAVWNDAAALVRLVRAYDPWPGVWTTWGSWDITWLEADSRPEDINAPAGTIVATSHGDGWGIVCRHGLFLPRRVVFSGKRPQSAATIPGSYPGFMGTRMPSA